MRFSASMIKTWMDCPKQAHFKKVLKLPEQRHPKTSYGTCMHDALELYNNCGNIEASVQRFKETWEDDSILGTKIDYWPAGSSWSELRERGIIALKKYHEDNRWETRTIVANELEFLVPFGEHKLHGFVDNLELTGSGSNRELRVIDFKSSSYTPSHLELRMDVQFSIYLYASTCREFWEDVPNGMELFEKLENTRRRGIWYSIWNGKMTDVGPRNELDMERLYRVMVEIEKAMEAEVYVPNLKAAPCQFCSYTNLCAVTIPLSQEVDIARRERQLGR